MKNLSRLMFVLLLLIGFNNANAQDDNNPWQFSFGINAVDLYPTGENAPLGEYFDEYFNVTDHYNILPSLSTFTVSKYMGDNLSFGIRGSVNSISKVGDSTTEDDLSYFAINGMLKYNLGPVLDWNKLQPYFGVGGGYTWVDKIGAGTVNGSFGLSYVMSETVSLVAESTYKHAFENYLPKHFEHSISVAFNFGGKDSDGDGIYDKNDVCPDVPGLAEFDGCPDSDGDGIEDSKDTCPNEAGLAEFDGCPDSDGDGISDNNDDCPNTAGLKSLNGCPDSDGDGLADGNDNCPNEAGPAANNGCPWPDSDGDGVLDKDDQCPNEAGTVANNGCPEINPTVEVMDTLNEYSRSIGFDTGKSTFKEKTENILNAMTAIFKEYPKANFTIEGHTDSTGSEGFNQKLSEKRANAVHDYLVANGISDDRLSTVGYGQNRPIDNNKTRAGRSNNRRVDVILND